MVRESQGLVELLSRANHLFLHLVDELMALKEKLRIAFGEPAAPAADAKKDAKKEKSEGKKDKAESKAPVPAPVSTVAVKPVEAPMKRPAYLSAGPKVAAAAAQTTSQVPPLSSVLTSPDTLDLNLLEARLVVFSYVGGYTPSKHDNT
jgi:uncharacterized membrane protein